MSILKFHAIGNWSEADVSIHRSTVARPTTPQIESMIDAAWQQAIMRPNVKLFNGEMCRLESWRQEGSQLHLTLAGTTYREFLGTNLTHPELADQLSPAHLSNPVGVSPALLTADNYLMMGRRNDTVAYYPNRIHPFAGAVDPKDHSPFDSIRRELNEELSFTDADIGDIRCTGIAEDRSIRQPELIFYVRSTRTRAQIESALDPAEHDNTWHIHATPDAVTALLKETQPTFTPVALASLILYARMAWAIEIDEPQLDTNHHE